MFGAGGQASAVRRARAGITRSRSSIYHAVEPPAGARPDGVLRKDLDAEVSELGDLVRDLDQLHLGPSYRAFGLGSPLKLPVLPVRGCR